jgi:hypothetical protein
MMFKRLFVVAAMVVAASSVLGVASAYATKPVQQKNVEEKVTICHRTDAVNNPYRRITVSQSAVDGAGKNDHTSHEGPVASSLAVAQALKASHTKWGDIIPAYGDYAGYNWTAEGQTVYNNGCNYPVVVTPQPAAHVTYTMTCDTAKMIETIVFSNDGEIAGTATLNGTSLTIDAKSSLSQTVVTGENGAKITIVIAGQTVFDQLVTCAPGKGSLIPVTSTGTTGGESTATTTPATVTPAAISSLPYTAGDNTRLIAIVASVIGTVVTALGFAAKTVLAKQL